MRLDSVRELKNSLPSQLKKAFSAKAGAVATESTAVAMAASRQRVVPTFFLGVTAKGKEYRLAVRLQDHALENSELVDQISSRAKGEVEIRYVGQIRARKVKAKAQSALWYRSKNRPLLIGSSVGFVASGFIMAGTLGCFVKKSSSSAFYILSNNHVLADENRYKKGKPITQPGGLDGGKPSTDVVATLTSFVRLLPGTANLVDCAMAKLVSGIAADKSALKGIGTLAGVITRDLEIHDVVHKVGRTTGVRHGKVTAVELDAVTVQYDIGVVSFDDQIEIEGSGTQSFSDSGDSGSLIVDDELKGAALLFAGSDHGGTNGKGLTYANPIGAVLSALKVKLAT
jgi:hypothetical protein